MKSSSLASLEQDVEQLLKSLFAKALEKGNTLLSIEEFTNGKIAGTKLAVIPKNSGPAEVHVLCENGVDLIYLTIGQFTSLEIPFEGQRYTQLIGPEEFIAVVRAVVEGRFEEEIWPKGSEVVKSIGKIHLGEGSPVRIHNLRRIFKSLFGSPDKQEHKYLPYG